MLTARYFSASGEPGDARELPEDLFDGVVNEAVLHQVVKAHLANQRQGTASTKTRTVVDLLRKIGSGEKKVLILTDGINSHIYLSTRNLQTVSVVPFSEVSAYDLMAAGELLIEAGALAPTTEVVNA